MTVGRLRRKLRSPSCDFEAVFTISEGASRNWGCLVMAGGGDPSGVGAIWVTCREARGASWSWSRRSVSEGRGTG